MSEKKNIGRELLSIIFLFAVFGIVDIIVAFVGSFVTWGLEAVRQYSTGVWWLTVIFGGTTIFGILFAPLFWGSAIGVALCDKIAGRSTPKKYTIFAVIASVYCIYSFIIIWGSGTFSLQSIYLLIFAWVLRYYGRSEK